VQQGSRDLKEFLLLARASAPVVVLWHPEQSELANGDDSGRARIEAIAKEAGVRVVDFSRLAPRAAPALGVTIERALGVTIEGAPLGVRLELDRGVTDFIPSLRGAPQARRGNPRAG
jgi:hypothetical protein